MVEPMPLTRIGVVISSIFTVGALSFRNCLSMRLMVHPVSMHTSCCFPFGASWAFAVAYFHPRKAYPPVPLFLGTVDRMILACCMSTVGLFLEFCWTAGRLDNDCDGDRS